MRDSSIVKIWFDSAFKEPCENLWCSIGNCVFDPLIRRTLPRGSRTKSLSTGLPRPSIHSVNSHGSGAVVRLRPASSYLCIALQRDSDKALSKTADFQDFNIYSQASQVVQRQASQRRFKGWQKHKLVRSSFRHLKDSME